MKRNTPISKEPPETPSKLDAKAEGTAGGLFIVAGVIVGLILVFSLTSLLAGNSLRSDRVYTVCFVGGAFGGGLFGAFVWRWMLVRYPRTVYALGLIISAAVALCSIFSLFW